MYREGSPHSVVSQAPGMGVQPVYPPQPRRYATPKLTRPQGPVNVQGSGAQRPRNPIGDKPQVSVYQGQGVNSMPQGLTTVAQKSVRHPLVRPQPEIQEGPSGLMCGGGYPTTVSSASGTAPGVLQAQPGVSGVRSTVLPLVHSWFELTNQICRYEVPDFS